jgi:hypothetical protein
MYRIEYECIGESYGREIKIYVVVVVVVLMPK